MDQLKDNQKQHRTDSHDGSGSSLAPGSREGIHGRNFSTENLKHKTKSNGYYQHFLPIEPSDPKARKLK